MPAAGDEKANFGGHISVPLLHVRRRLPLFTQSASSAVPDSAAGYRCAGNGLSLPAIGCSPVPPPARPLPAPKLLGLFRAAGGSNRPGSPSPAPRQISPPAVTTRTHTPPPPPPPHTHSRPPQSGGRAAGRGGRPRSPIRPAAAALGGGRSAPQEAAGANMPGPSPITEQDGEAGARAPGPSPIRERGTRHRAGCGPAPEAVVPRRTHLSAAEAAGPRPAPASPPLPLTPPSSPPYLGHPAGGSQRPATPGPPTRPQAYWVPLRCISRPVSAVIGQQAPSITEAGLPPPSLSFLIGPGEGTRLETDWLKPRQQGWPGANPPVTSTRI